MNKFVIGALALSSAGSLAYAGGDETREWSTLDRDILSLTSSSNQGGTAGSFGVNGFIRARGVRSQDVDVDTGTAGNQDLSGFLLDNARLEFNGSQGDYGVHISIDAANTVDTTKDGTAALFEGYATFKIAEGVSGQAGRFRRPFLWSSFLVEDNNLVLMDRTFNGQYWQGTEDGVQLSGVYDHLGWWAALQNGQDGLQDKISWTARVAVNVLGTGVGHQEGAFGASGDINIMLGAAYSDDEGADQAGGNINSGGAWAIDGGLTQGPVSIHAELVDYQHDVQPDSAINLNTGAINALSTGAATGMSKTPWSATVGYMLTPDTVEVVARYEDLDDDDNTTVWTVGVNYYLSGHNAKWTLQGSRSNSDMNIKEADTAALGLTVGV